VVVAVLIWGIGEGLRYILARASTHLKREQLEERLTALEQRIDAVDTRLTRYEETVGPQLKTLGGLLSGIERLTVVSSPAGSRASSSHSFRSHARVMSVVPLPVRT